MVMMMMMMMMMTSFGAEKRSFIDVSRGDA
jgi:hypothetical protein